MFVLTKGGHNGGILSEPGHSGRHYRMSHRPAGALYTGPDGWLAQQEPKAGSWWPEWAEWLAAKSSGAAPVPQTGAPDKGFAPLAEAPGSYVFQL